MKPVDQFGFSSGRLNGHIVFKLAQGMAQGSMATGTAAEIARDMARDAKRNPGYTWAYCDAAGVVHIGFCYASFQHAESTYIAAMESLSRDELMRCQWRGIYTQRQLVRDLIQHFRNVLNMHKSH